MSDCVFCNIKHDEYLFENDLAFAIKDGMPACKGHCLVIPKRHVKTFFDLTGDEIKAMYELANKVKEYIDNLSRRRSIPSGSTRPTIWCARRNFSPVGRKPFDFFNLCSIV